MTPAIDAALKAMKDADDILEERNREQSVARGKRDDAVSAVIQTFMEAWNALPTDIRNKVRHEINTAKQV